MVTSRMKTYMALLLTMSMTAGAVMSVGDAQARIEGSATVHNTVLRVRSEGMNSDLLNAAGDQTILLGSLASAESVDAAFTLQTREPVSCHMAWYTAEGLPIQTQVAFELLEGEGSLDEHNLLTMEANSKAVVILTVTAADEIPEAAVADVQMFCGNLSGTFRVELIADPPPVTEPEESEEQTEPTEPTEPEEPEAPTDPQESGGLEVVLPDVEEEDQGGGLDVVLPGGPGNPEQISPDMAQVELSSLSEFEVTSALPVKVTLRGLADALWIGLEGEEPLPALTRYSTDGGVHWFVLYDEGSIVLDGASEEDEEVQWLLLVDFSRSDLWLDLSMGLEATARIRGETSGTAVKPIIPRAGPEQTEDGWILRGPNARELQWLTLLTADETAAEPVETEPQESETPDVPTEPAEPFDLEETDDSAERAYFRIPLPIGWAEATQIQYQAQFLAAGADGTVGFTPVEWDHNGLNAVEDPENGELIVYLGPNVPAAGTYRLTLECIYEGICFHQMQTTFFINYSTRSDMEHEEVPNYE